MYPQASQFELVGLASQLRNTRQAILIDGVDLDDDVEVVPVLVRTRAVAEASERLGCSLLGRSLLGSARTIRGALVDNEDLVPADSPLFPQHAGPRSLVAITTLRNGRSPAISGWIVTALA